MNRFSVAFLFILSSTAASAQNFRGQWKGYFIDKSVSALSFGGERCDYTIDLDIKGKEITGYSYTYFSDGGQKYYTICTLVGKADKLGKTIAVTETARVKTNVPDNISNSFQIHSLSWRKDGVNEILEGKWQPAPGQTNTGFGETHLEKRQLTEISEVAKRINAKKDPEGSPETALTSPFAKVKSSVKTTSKTPVTATAKTPVKVTAPVAKAPAKVSPPVAKATVKTPLKPAVSSVASASVKQPGHNSSDTSDKIIPATLTVKTPGPRNIPASFEKRDNTVLQTVNVEGATVKIELYDNGEVDGDSISVFYNGNVLLAHKRLSEKPILTEIPIVPDEVNELVMYADNLGTVPPNTALMIVYDGQKRYEVRITSDLKKSGTIRFVHRSRS